MFVQDEIAKLTAWVDELNTTVSLGDICFAPLMPEGSDVQPYNCSIMVGKYSQTQTKLSACKMQMFGLVVCSL